MKVGILEQLVADAVSELLPIPEGGGIPSGPLMARLAAAAGRLPGVAGAGVMWQHGPRLRHADATDAVMAELQRLQEARQDGPSVEAFRSVVTVAVTDLGASRRWRHVSEAARRAGVAAVAAVPVSERGRPAGALAVWARSGRAWPADHLSVLSLLSDLVTTRLHYEEEYGLLARTGGDLRHAIHTRVLVEQAKGLLAGQRGISVDRALGLMRRYARDRGRTLHSVAEELVSGRLRI